MTPEELRKQFKKESGENWTNSQGEPNIDYVNWLESKPTTPPLTDEQLDIMYSAARGMSYKEFSRRFGSDPKREDAQTSQTSNSTTSLTSNDTTNKGGEDD